MAAHHHGDASRGDDEQRGQRQVLCKKKLRSRIYSLAAHGIVARTHSQRRATKRSLHFPKSRLPLPHGWAREDQFQPELPPMPSASCAANIGAATALAGDFASAAPPLFLPPSLPPLSPSVVNGGTRGVVGLLPRPLLSTASLSSSSSTPPPPCGFPSSSSSPSSCDLPLLLSLLFSVGADASAPPLRRSSCQRIPSSR